MTCPRCQMYPCRCRARYGLRAVPTAEGPMLWSKADAWDFAEQAMSPGGAAAKAFCDGRKVGVLIGAGAVGLLWAGAIAWYMRKKR